MIKRTILMLLLAATSFSIAGCYVYSTEEPPTPVVIFPNRGDVVVPSGQQPATPQTPPAPSGAPTGQVGPPR